MCAGAACTTIYPSNTPAECEFILNDSATRIVFAEDASQVDKLRQIRAEIPGVTKVILFEGAGQRRRLGASAWAEFSGGARRRTRPIPRL
jgi:long-subunit acyl-CoA synthetase (AMP-forming)